MRQNFWLLTILSAGALFQSHGQDLVNGTSGASVDLSRANSAPFTIAERGPNHRLWQQVTWVTNASGIALARTNSYTEIATGMAHWVNGELVDSTALIQATATGAVSSNAAHTVTFLGNINSAGAIDIALPDGQHLRGNPLCLSYFDTASGKSVLIAQVKDSLGQLFPSGTDAIYPDAFTDFRCDILYENAVSGFEQLIVLREQPPSPTEWGLNPETTMFQVITEFLNPPTPQVSTIQIENDQDNYLDFGTMQMGPGVAFALGNETNQVRVMKHWAVLNGRNCLIEEVPFQAVVPQLSDLPPPVPESGSLGPSPGSPVHRLALDRELPSKRLVAKTSTPLRLASHPKALKGFAMDYTLLNSQTNLTLQMDSTYYCSGTVNVSSNLVIEGGSVTKFTNSTAATIIASNVVCKTGMYRPAVFTSKDDNSLGQNITGSSGSPSGYYANIALNFSSASSLPTLSNLRFHYLSNAISGANIVLQNCQIINCKNAFAAGSTSPSAYNVLLYLVNSALANTSAGTLTGENVTGHFITNFFGNTSGTVNLTNCLFACVTNWQCTTTKTNSSAFLNSDSGLFQTVGTAAHYLAADSPYRNAGTTSINSSLLADLTKRTTYPPLNYGPMTSTTNLTLAPQAQRDNDVPDLSYHYDVLDYTVSGLVVTNSTLSVTPGTAIGVYGTNTTTFGLGIGSSGVFACRGSPNNLAEIAEFNTVQEQANSNWKTPSTALVTDNQTGSNLGIASRFTDLSVMAQDVPHFWGLNNKPIYFQDCQFHGGQLTTFWGTIYLTNCLLERVSADLEATDGLTPVMMNNLVWYGNFTFAPSLSGSIIKDNFFDHPTIPNDMGILTNIVACNAYVTNCDRFTNTTDIILPASPTYQTGPLGNYYLLSTSTLINAGTNATADTLGLYQYTVCTNLVSGLQVKETNSLVDVMFHYVATDANGNPEDSDGDGIPDYLEDANGNGKVDSGETSWTSATDLGLKVLITKPKNNSVIP